MAEGTNRSPVNYLLPDLIKTFEYTTNNLSDARQWAIRRAVISLKLEEDYTTFVAPRLRLPSNVISLHESYLSYVWCCCFALIGFNNIYYRRAFYNEPITRFNDDPEFRISIDTLEWGRSLRNEYSLWPAAIANPTQGGESVNYANNLFVGVVMNLLYHEVGHVILHASNLDFIIKTQTLHYDKTSDDYKKLRRMESEADDYAFDCLITSSNVQEERFIKQLSAIVAHLINLYHLETADTRSTSHPDSDDRLRRIVKLVKVTNRDEHIQMKAMCCLGVQLFMSLTDVQFIPNSEIEANFVEFEDLENYLFGLISNMKEEARESGR